ncbi:hypothetical protein [Novipirellula maiorica]|uniref:hypothetical protein n=1 Tax=Novipirellula maiorica TaxID=1265734 RepID=UPI00191C36B1|nr:hypothetical protein [Rhodopirellula maiorica]
MPSCGEMIAPKEQTNAMTQYKPNSAAKEKAKSLVKSHQYVVDSDWGDAQPSSDDENKFLETHDWDEYAKWFLAVDPDAGKHTKGRFHFPFGDFGRLHRSGLIAAKQRAAQNNHPKIEAAIDELLNEFESERDS